MPKRVLYAGAAWAAATATAMAVVWAGLDAVLPTATQGLHVATIAAWPVQNAVSSGPGRLPAVSPSRLPASSPTDAETSHRAPTSPPDSGHSPSAPATSPGSSASAGAPSLSPTPGPPSPQSTEQRYSTPGGTVVLNVGPKTASIAAATPAPGYSVRSWNGQDFVEVEFSPGNGGTVYEVIATWNGTSPQVQTVTVG